MKVERSANQSAGLNLFALRVVATMAIRRTLQRHRAMAVIDIGIIVLVVITVISATRPVSDGTRYGNRGSSAQNTTNLSRASAWQANGAIDWGTFEQNYCCCPILDWISLISQQLAIIRVRYGRAILLKVSGRYGRTAIKTIHKWQSIAIVPQLSIDFIRQRTVAISAPRYYHPHQVRLIEPVCARSH